MIIVIDRLQNTIEMPVIRKQELAQYKQILVRFKQ